MINANMIDKVEVMTTPSAKYDPDGIAGIIKIILTKNEYLQFNKALKNLTTNILDNYKNIFKIEEDKLKLLSAKILKVSNSNLSYIQKIFIV